MAFRDDRDALRAKNALLEEELAEAREQLDEAKGKLERRNTERRAKRARALLGQMKKWFNDNDHSTWIVVAAILAVLGFSAISLFVSTDEPKSGGSLLFSGEGHVMAIRGEPGVTTGDDCDVRIEPHDSFPWNCQVFVTCNGRQLYSGFTECSTEDGEAVFAHDTAYESDNDPIMRFDREAQSVLVEDASWSVDVTFGPRPPIVSGRATWTGVVERAVDADVEVDRECTLAAEIASNGYVPDAVELSIRCGDDELYRSDAITPGLDWHIEEGPAPAEGRFEYALSFEDAAGDAARMRARVDTRQRRARVWRDGAPPMFVEFRVDDVSAPRDGAPLNRANESAQAHFAETVDASARVTMADSSSPAAVDELCRFELRPAWDSEAHNCRLTVRCGTRFLYGAGGGGFTTCTVIDGIPVAASSEEDAGLSMRYQREGGTVALRSFDAARPWIAELQMEPDGETPQP